LTLESNTNVGERVRFPTPSGRVRFAVAFVDENGEPAANLPFESGLDSIMVYPFDDETAMQHFLCIFTEAKKGRPWALTFQLSESYRDYEPLRVPTEGDVEHATNPSREGTGSAKPTDQEGAL